MLQADPLSSFAEMANLRSLPVELIFEICTKLKSSPADLSRFSRTCISLRNIAQPVLFTSVDPPDPATCDMLVKFLRSLRSRPDLAAHLLSFRDGAGGFIHQRRIPEGDRDYINQVLADLELPILTYLEVDDADWSQGSDYTWIIELIVLHAPNLASLKVTAQWGWRLPILRAYAVRFENGPFLPRLRSLQICRDIDANRGNPTVPIDYILDICAAAPQLDDLYIHNPASYFGLRVSPRVNPFSRIRRLHFGNWSSCDADKIGEFMAAAPKMETVILRWKPFMTMVNWGKCWAVDIWKALAVRKRTLKEIRLHIDAGTVDFDRLDDDQQEAFEPLEVGETDRYSLRDFEKLEVLEIGWMALRVLTESWERQYPDDYFGHWENIFPRGIREVTLPDNSDHLHYLAKAVESGCYPALKKVAVESQGWSRSPSPDNAEGQLESAFARAGVKFGQGEYSWWHEDWF